MSFYVLISPKANKQFLTDFTSLAPDNSGDAPQCPVCGRYIGMLPWLPPYRAQIEIWGDEAGDIVFGPGDELLVSEKFKHEYENNGLNGILKFIRTEVVSVKSSRKLLQKNLPFYFVATIKRSRAIIDHVLSELILDQPWTCDECRLGGIVKRISRVVIEENTWSGEDIFFARGLPGKIITSEKFRNFCINSDIKNCELIEAKNYSFDFYPWEKK
jgi:hypothetical protein